MNLTRQEYRTVVGWFDTVDKLNPDHLEDKDNKLVNKIQTHIDVPSFTPNKVTKEYLEQLVDSSSVEEHIFRNKELVVSYKLSSGFVVTGRTAVVDPKNFALDIGREICREDAIKQLWQLEGYVLQLRLADQIVDNR